MQELLEAPLVRIHSTSGQVVGAGFLVGERQVLTCAHVVAGALGLADDISEKPQSSVPLDVPLVAAGQLLTARVILWRPPLSDGGEDIAGLELEDDPPAGAQAAPLAQIEDLWGHSFRVFGFPRGEDSGVWATGRCLGRQGSKWVQIEDVKETGFAVEPGFSGTPIWDEQVEAVVGMIVATERRMNLKTAFAIPVDVLARSWPLLEAFIQPFVFLCYARADSDHVTRLKNDLLSQGIQVWIDREGLQPGTPDWEETLRAAIRAARAVLLIASPHARSSRYVRDELRIAEMYQRPVYPLWIAGTHWMDAVPLGWGGAQYLDARESYYETALPELVGHLNTVPPAPTSASVPDFEPRNPYKGLRAFKSEDTRDFFGRDALINELVTALEGTLASEEKNHQCARLLAVIGPSGSGKSSVVMAGLLPRLREGGLPGSEQWVYLDPIVPGTSPLETLTLALWEQLPDKSLKAIREDLEEDSARGLHLLATKLVRRTEAKVVLLVDQFEELFTQTLSEDERRHFIDLLITAVTEPQGSVIVLLTLRADFYDRPLAHQDLGHLIPSHQRLVLPMTQQELRAVIEQPAALPDVRLSFEGDLVGDLLFEVQGQAGALPLLQFTLDQLFQRRNGSQLTLSAYRELGGVKGALTRQAEETYAALPSDEHRKLARALFVRLIDPGASEKDTTRRRAALSEFTLVEASQTRLLQETINAFIAARLLTTNEIAGTTTIEVSHEALIREWRRPGDWLVTYRNDILIQKAISEDTAQWLRRDKPIDHLYRGSQLVEAQTWAERNVPSQNEDAFLQASVAEGEREEREKHAQQAREMALQQKLTRRQRYVIGLIGAVAIILLAALIITIQLQAQVLARFPPVVSNLSDSGEGSLREAIRAAHPGDTITFAKDLGGKTLTLTSGELEITRDLVISGPGASPLTISGGHTNRVFDVSPDVVLTISKLTIKDGYAAGGGSGDYGGGIFADTRSVLILINCIISGNTAARDGGGIENHVGTIILDNTTVSDNKAISGAGIYNGQASGTNMSRLILKSSVVSNNAAAMDGGGIFNEGELTLTDTTISGNTATTGGGVNNVNDLTLTRSTISANRAKGDGGGIANTFDIMLTNSTLSGNIAGEKGGGIVNGSSEGASTIVFIRYCTIYGNISKVGGGIVGSSSNSAMYISASIIGGNHANPGPDIAGTLSEDPDFGYYRNLIQDSSDIQFLSFRGAKAVMDNELIRHIITNKSPNLGPLKNNGGITSTHALLEGSPAIDQISDGTNLCSSRSISLDYSLDQRGIKRPQGAGCDLGAYEYVPRSA